MSYHRPTGGGSQVGNTYCCRCRVLAIRREGGAPSGGSFLASVRWLQKMLLLLLLHSVENPDVEVEFPSRSEKKCQDEGVDVDVDVAVVSATEKRVTRDRGSSASAIELRVMAGGEQKGRRTRPVDILLREIYSRASQAAIGLTDRKMR